MDRAELFASLAQASPSPEDTVYVERRGTEYSWRRFGQGGDGQDDSSAQPGAGADVWMYFSGAWPREDPAASQAFCEDMLAEMESMAGGDDRCRWPLDQPWPHLH
ncbi:MAG: hypothetical protein H0U22_10085 [Geodermatophilaceae bacterium]|nr:hypothetical protein [Geodermatophilaceae bacterium]